GTLNITNWELTDEEGVFSLLSNPGSVSLSSGESIDVSITYNPASGQVPPHRGSLIVTSNAFGVAGTTTSLVLAAQPRREVSRIADWMPVTGNSTISNHVNETPALTRPWELAPAGEEARY
ncbi:hypothetical protein HQ520_10700, partial [bacterium]|nr:hypothetical protein [bacterium]